MSARQWIGAALAGLIAAVAMLGSIAGLVAFAAKGHSHIVTLPGLGYDVPLGMWAFVASLDGLAVVMALQVHDHSKGIDWPALGVLIGATLTSAVLQYLAAGDGWEDKAVATSPVLLAGVATAMFFRSLGRGRPAKAKPRSKPATEPQRAVAPPPPLPSAPKRSEAIEAASRPALAVVPPTEDEMAEQVDAWLAEHGRRPSKDSVKAAGAALMLPCRGNDTAVLIARLVRERRARTA